ncbi:MAG: DUF4136 domain-containing protein [Gemmatimonadales bacterium]
MRPTDDQLGPIQHGCPGIHRFRAEPGFQPDVITSISITASRNYQAYTFYPWWGWPTTVVSSYRVDTIFIDMIDVDQSIASDTIEVIWNGAINGPFEGTEAVSMERIDRLFNQAFVQSEYLRLLTATP